MEAVIDPINSDLLLTRCDFLVESQLWPIESKLNYQGWLNNFETSEMKYAEGLLNAFTYFSQDITIEMFRFAFRQLASYVIDYSDGAARSIEQWEAFKKSLLVTLVRGEDPNATDSGFLFLRYARQNLGIDAEQIVSNQKAIETLHFDDQRPLLLVDDFAGSGSQFCETWTTPATIATNIHKSFEDVMRAKPFSAFFCPVIAASQAVEKIARCGSEVKLRPAHIVDPTFSLIGTQSQCWSNDLREGAENFLRTASRRAGYPTDWRGFHDLGLAIAFEHGTPDATLPIFYSERNGWTPLVKRS